MVHIAVIGAGDCSERAAQLAYETGRLIGSRNAVLVCGGLGGVMEHAARGAKDAGGLTVGILPGVSKAEANPYIDIALPTGMSHARNVLVVRAADGVIAIEGAYGTLSEIAIALKLGKPVVGLNTWNLTPDIIQASGPADALEKLFKVMSKVI
ncbi:MAG: TIGR00725 family protein [Desulfobacterota bacterium]|nr:TIGR00725 family protein [Thermodesulfobacteriota bacterium]